MSVYSQFEPEWASADDCPCAKAGEFDSACTKRECRERHERETDESAPCADV